MKGAVLQEKVIILQQNSRFKNEKFQSYKIWLLFLLKICNSTKLYESRVYKKKFQTFVKNL